MNKFIVKISALLSLGVLTIGSVAFCLDADKQPTSVKTNLVVELFTSQGCPSCPPADAMLRSLRDKKGVLGLSWPIDYWDRLGWEDTFAKREHSARQSAYNKRIGMSGVYTPQMIFNGAIEGKGSDKTLVKAKIIEAKKKQSLVLSPIMRIEKDQLKFSLSSYTKGAIGENISVRIVYYLRDAAVKVDGGENRGRTLHYCNIVRASNVISDWDGKAKDFAVNIQRPTVPVTHVAILLQQRYSHGKILGAASLKLPE